MPSRARALAGFALSHENVSYAGTIAVLSLILWMGHVTHWEFGSLPGLTIHAFSASHEETPRPDLRLDGSETEPDENAIVLSDAALAKAGIELGVVEQQRIGAAIHMGGVVAYNQNLRAELATRVPGNVWRIEKHVGQKIQKGDVLAIIEASEVGRAKGELLQAIVERELKETNFRRLRQLDGGVAERHVREAEAGARQAVIHAQVCAQALVNLGVPVSLSELEQLGDDERAERIQFAGLPESIVSTLEPHATTANLLPLVSPFDGVVIGRNMAIGELVSPEEPHFEIADIRKVWVILDVRKEDANQVRLGQTIAFKPDGYAGDVAGVIDWISTAMDEKTRTLQVRAEVENPISDEIGEKQPTYLLRAHTYGTGRILVRNADNAVAVPVESVQLDHGKQYVFVRDKGRFVRTAVELGSKEGGHVEVRRGLSAGMTIATIGSHVLKAQMQIVAATH